MGSTFNHEELARGDEQLAQLEEQLSKLASRHPSDPQTRMDEFRSDIPDARPSLSGWAVRGFTGLLLAACIGGAAIAWWPSSRGDAAKTAPPQPAPPAQTAPLDVARTATALSPELTQLLQSMARDLVTVGQGIERLKASQEQMTRDNTNVADQLKASQEQMARDIANVAQRLEASQEQMARDIAKVSEQNLPPKIPVPPPRPAVTPTHKPVPTLASPQASVQLQAKKPKPSSAPPQPTPVR